ncbi:MAG: universal stress protein [Myxococcota bacterium]
MPSINHILLTTDFSKAARATYTHAQALARLSGARITLLHVDEAPIADFAYTEDFVRYHSHMAELRNRLLSEDVVQLSQDGLTVHVETRTGSPAFVILETAQDLEVDLIMMARQSRRGLAQWLMGSTTRRVARRTQIPLWVLPAGVDEDHYPAPPPYSTILTATDFSEDSELGFQITAAWARMFEAKLVLTHIVPPPVEVMMFPGDAPVMLPQGLQQQIEEAQHNRLEQLVKHHGHQCQVRLDTGSPSEGIVRVAEREGAGLIMLPSHGKGAIRANMFGSTTESVLEIAKVPVMVLPRPWLQAQRETQNIILMPVLA